MPDFYEGFDLSVAGAPNSLPAAGIGTAVALPSPTYPIAWLLDDDDFTNLLTERVIRQHRFAGEVCTFTMAEDALRQFERLGRQHPEALPAVIFIDINMPFLNGWDFLLAFEQFPAAVRERCTLYILSSSASPSELTRHQQAHNVRACLPKPLSGGDIALLRRDVS